jgi:putative DNA methylase
MAVFTATPRVLDAGQARSTVREALALINQTLDEALAQREATSTPTAAGRWPGSTMAFQKEGRVAHTSPFEYGGRNVEAGIDSGAAKCACSGRNLPADWDPATDPRLTAWEIVHQLIRVLASGGEGAAAGLVAKLGAKAEIARELAYRLYTLCERKKRAPEALAYNGLVQSWPEIARLAREGGTPRAEQAGLFEEDEE